uniref:Uncharacterized protein n=1 Tax=Acrobeloides nanus TaxID=290746 RepID=A0A914CQK2_9BILA
MTSTINEFSESDSSDYEFEEKDLLAEEDYEQDDDYLLDERSFSNCDKTNYEDDWIPTPSYQRPYEFEYMASDIPKRTYKSPDEAFSSLISYKIIKV